MSEVKVEHHPELSRNEYSKGITNIDNDAYSKYMHGALARKNRNATLQNNTKEINNLKEDMLEIKDMLRQLISKQNGN
tara:strand:- start:280 stop:513 length:234 start_codon:yes stop_codon:yes gene_type:complete